MFNAQNDWEEGKAKLLNAQLNILKFMDEVWRKAGIDPVKRAIAIGSIVNNEMDIPLPYLGLDKKINTETEDLNDVSDDDDYNFKYEKTYSITDIAKLMGIRDSTGNPAFLAVNIILTYIDLSDDECVRDENNIGNKYKTSVINKVRQWLEMNDYPAVIISKDGLKAYVSYGHHL